jgi:hypothetical protein
MNTYASKQGMRAKILCNKLCNSWLVLLRLKDGLAILQFSDISCCQKLILGTSLPKLIIASRK